MKKTKLWFVQIGTFFISSLAILLSYFASYESTKLVLAYSIIVGIIFWTTLITGIALIFVIGRNFATEGKKQKVGVVRFFSNKFALWCDIVMLVFLALTLIVCILKVESFWGSIVLAIFVFSFEMHCVLNGKFGDLLIESRRSKNEEV